MLRKMRNTESLSMKSLRVINLVPMPSFKGRSEIDGRLDNSLQVQSDEEIPYWRNVMKRVVAVVKLLCSRGLAFRRKNENLVISITEIII